MCYTEVAISFLAVAIAITSITTITRCPPPQLVVAPSGERLRGKAGMVFVAGKTVWSMPEHFKVVFVMQGAIQVLGFFYLLVLIVPSRRGMARLS